MKWFILTALWFCCLSVGFLFGSDSWNRLDPMDDFSITLNEDSIEHRSHLISETKVTGILLDRLDLLPRNDIPKLAKHLLFLCDYYRFDPAFILSLIEVESSFRVRAISPVGALGLMQVMLPTAQFIAYRLGLKVSGHEGSDTQDVRDKKLDPEVVLDPFLNLSLGMAYLNWLRNRYIGRSGYHILAAYNLGPSRLDELLSRKTFTPVDTKKYYNKIRKRISYFRFYSAPQLVRL